MSRRVVRRWYESWVGGKLWCGSSDAAEVIEHSAGKENVEYSMIVTYEVEKREDWNGQLPAGPDHVHNG